MDPCGSTADSPSMPRVQSWARIAALLGAGDQVPTQRSPQTV